VHFIGREAGYKMTATGISFDQSVTFKALKCLADRSLAGSHLGCNVNLSQAQPGLQLAQYDGPAQVSMHLVRQRTSG
jgi:hypothetical protein